MGMLDKIEIPRKMCAVIFLLDTSGSMSGASIGAVNEAIENVLPELVTMNENNPDNEIKVAIMKFDFDAEWVFGGDELLLPEEVRDTWNGLDANGYTSMGAAFEALNEKLSVNRGFMKRASGSVAPVLFLLSDGAPTDDYQAGLQKLQNNNWYKIAVRVAVGYSEQCNDDVLREFTGNPETVLHTNDAKELKKMIKFIAVTSSRVASQGSGLSTDTSSPDDNTSITAEAIKAQGGALNAPTDDDDEW